MLDIFGREAKRGDIIALTSQGMRGATNYQTYSRARLGIVNNILPKRQWMPGSWQYKRVFNRYNKAINTPLGAQGYTNSNQHYSSMQLGKAMTNNVNVSFGLIPGPDYYEVMEKITYYPFEPNNVIGTYPNGKKHNPHSTNQFLLVEYHTLTQEWKDAYDKVKQAYKILS